MINTSFWTLLSAGYLVCCLSEGRINYHVYNRCVYWAQGKIHYQLSISFVILLAIFAIFNTYAAAFTAAFGVNVVLNSYNSSIVMTNLSRNADTLISNDVALLPGILGNELDSNLALLSNIFSSNYTPNQMLPFLSVDSVQTQGMGGMALGTLCGATAMNGDNPKIEGILSAAIGLKVTAILLADIGTNSMQFTTAGTHARTGCTTTGLNTQGSSQFYNNLYTMFNISTPSCGKTSHAHDMMAQMVYDAYACHVGSTIVTGIIRTNPSTAKLVESMECSTTLSDAL
jgi:hypothetical protein